MSAEINDLQTDYEKIINSIIQTRVILDDLLKTYPKNFTFRADVQVELNESIERLVGEADCILSLIEALQEEKNG